MLISQLWDTRSSRGSNPGRGRIFLSAPKTSRPVQLPPPFLRRGSFQGAEHLRVDANLHVVSGLRTSAATSVPAPPLSLSLPKFTFTAWKRKTLPLAFISQSEKCDCPLYLSTQIYIHGVEMENFAVSFYFPVGKV